MCASIHKACRHNSWVLKIFIVCLFIKFSNVSKSEQLHFDNPYLLI